MLGWKERVRNELPIFVSNSTLNLHRTINLAVICNTSWHTWLCPQEKTLHQIAQNLSMGLCANAWNAKPLKPWRLGLGLEGLAKIRALFSGNDMWRLAWYALRQVPFCFYMCYYFVVVVWRSGNALVSINEVNLCCAQLVLGWVTVSGFDSR